MGKRIIFLILSVLIILASCKKDELPYPPYQPIQDKVRFEQGGFTLYWKTEVQGFDPGIKKNMVETFFKTYLRLVGDVNPEAPKTVTFKIVPVALIGTQEYPAYTSATEITYNAKYLLSNPTDWDLVTHELVHVMQNGYQYIPWLTEGIADYFRFIYGVHNVTGWYNAFLSEKAYNYKEGYGKTGRFLLWLEKNVKTGIVKSLDSELKTNQYAEPTTWKKLTGYDLNTLAEMYKASPDSNIQ